MVPSVGISSVTSDTVIFVTDAKAATATNGSSDSLRRVLGTFAVPRWTVKPTPPPQAGFPHPPPAVDLVPNAVGTLYLDVAGLQTQGISAVGPCYIRGAHAPLLSDEQTIELKWPDCGGQYDQNPLSLVPQRIAITGYASGATPADHTVDLFDAALALPGQNLQWNGSGTITLALTPPGFAAFGTPYVASGKLQIFPTAIEVIGTPEGGHLNKVDLRDLTSACLVQSFQWDNPADPVTVQLTMDGLALFGIYPGDLVAAIKLVADADPKLIAAFERVYRATRAMERWGELRIRMTDTPANRQIKQILARLGRHP